MAHSSCVQLGVQWETSDNQMLQTEINKKNTEIKVLLNTQNLNWPFFRTMYRKLNIIGINNHSNIFKVNKNSIQKAGSGYLCYSWLHSKVRLKVRHQALETPANRCSFSCRTAQSSARWSTKPWIAKLCMLQNSQHLPYKFLLLRCMFVCFHAKLYFLGCMSWYADTIDRSKNQPALWEHLTSQTVHFPIASKAQMEQLLFNTLLLQSPC